MHLLRVASSTSRSSFRAGTTIDTSGAPGFLVAAGASRGIRAKLSATFAARSSQRKTMTARTAPSISEGVQERPGNSFSIFVTKPRMSSCVGSPFTR